MVRCRLKTFCLVGLGLEFRVHGSLGFGLVRVGLGVGFRLIVGLSRVHAVSSKKAHCKEGLLRRDDDDWSGRRTRVARVVQLCDTLWPWGMGAFRP